MNKKEIDPIDGSFDEVTAMIIKETKSELVATHTGELTLGEITIPCHVLADGTRVLSRRGMQKSLAFLKSSSGSALRNFVESKISKYLSANTIEKFDSPIKFKRTNSGGSVPETFGLDVTVFIDFCDAIIEAKKNNILTESERVHANAAESISKSCC